VVLGSSASPPCENESCFKSSYTGSSDESTLVSNLANVAELGRDFLLIGGLHVEGGTESEDQFNPTFPPSQTMRGVCGRPRIPVTAGTVDDAAIETGFGLLCRGLSYGGSAASCLTRKAITVWDETQRISSSIPMNFNLAFLPEKNPTDSNEW
jgi:hypothetical protein